LAVLAGEHQTSGVTSRRLQRLLPTWTRSQIARLLRRLRLHGLSKLAGLKLQEHLLLPALATT